MPVLGRMLPSVFHPIVCPRSQFKQKRPISQRRQLDKYKEGDCMARLWPSGDTGTMVKEGP